MKNSCFLILGMHRSGTSALAAALSCCDVSFGSNLFEASEDNQLGYWEDRNIVFENEAVLNSLISPWDGIFPLPNVWWQSPKIAQHRENLKNLIVRQFGNSSAWAVKDPRICILLPMWLDLLDELRCETNFILIHRDPMEVASSLAKRDSFETSKALHLWLVHNLEAEYYTRYKSRVFTSYARLLADPETEVTSILKKLGYNNLADNIDREKLASLVAHNLRHHRIPLLEISKLKSTENTYVSKSLELLSILEKADENFINSKQEYLDSLRAEFSNFPNLDDLSLLKGHIVNLQQRVVDIKDSVEKSYKVIAGLEARVNTLEGRLKMIPFYNTILSIKRKFSTSNRV